jgi:hypothetical protein
VSSGNDDELEAIAVRNEKKNCLCVNDSLRIGRDMSSIWTGQSLEATSTKNVIAHIVCRQSGIPS